MQSIAKMQAILPEFAQQALTDRDQLRPLTTGNI
jgi:hypothetical protein